MQKTLLFKQREIEEEVFKSAEEIINHYKTVLKNKTTIKPDTELLYSKKDIKNIIKYFIILEFCKGNLNITKFKFLYLGLSKFQKINPSNNNYNTILDDIEVEEVKLKSEFYHFLKCLQTDFSILIKMKTELNFPTLFIKDNYIDIFQTINKLFLKLEPKKKNTSKYFKNLSNQLKEA